MNNKNLTLADIIVLQREQETSPCLVVVPTRLGTNECQVEVSFSYRDAARALRDHRKWLSNVCHSHRSWLLQQQQQQQRSSGHPNASGLVTAAAALAPPSNVVLAYLAHNSGDLFLSVLASTHAAETTSIPACVAALLNTRWTVHEIVQALKVSDVDNEESVHCTVIIYDSQSDELEEMARQAEQILSSTADVSRHHILCLPLPLLLLFAREMTSTTTTAINATSSEQTTTSLVKPPPCNTHSAFPPEYPAVSSDDAVIAFTSGTTGGSKGVRLGHRAIYVQCFAKLQEPCGYDKSTRLLANTVPFFHVGGLSSVWAVWLAGGTLVLPTTTTKSKPMASFDAPITLEVCRQRWANTLVVVPAMLYALQQQEQQQQQHTRKRAAVGKDGKPVVATSVHYPEVQLILIGGQSAESSSLQWVRQAFPNARLVQTYACTEAASSLTFHTVTTHEEDSFPLISGDCVGIPPPHVELRLFRPDAAVAVNDKDYITEPLVPGIIATRGPHVMNGYWSRTALPSVSSSSPSSLVSTPLPHNTNWHRTSDMGYWGTDRTTLYFSGRATDSIRTGGETVLAAEVERCLRQHPRIAECAVVALPDRRLGETVACAIVLSDPQRGINPTSGHENSNNNNDNNINNMEPTIRAWCEQQGLAGYKRPRLVFRVDELPRNSSGKVLKFKLVERFVARQRSRL